MSWLFSQALVVEYLVAICSDGKPFAQLKSTPMPQAYCSNDRTTEFCQIFQYGMIFAPLTDGLGGELLMWFLEGFRAKKYPVAGPAKDLMVNDQDYGEKWQGSLAKYSHSTRSWKTHQCSLFGGFGEFSGTWPRWGMMRNGELYRLKTPALYTREKGYSFWPTPTASDAESHRNNYITMAKCFGKDYQQRPSYKFAAIYGMNPSSELWDYLMGFPLAWTQLKPLEMRKFQSWQQQHSKYFLKASAQAGEDGR